MLDATRPDLLDIVTPPAAHLALLGAAAERGIDVDLPEAARRRSRERAGDGAAGRGGRHHARGARELPLHAVVPRGEAPDRAGTFGRLLDVAFRLRPGDGQGPRAYLDRQPYFQQMPRFLIHETAIHLIDVFRYLGGEVAGVFARLRRLNPAIRGEDAGHVLFDFTSGAAGLFDGNRLAGFPAANPRLTMGEMWLDGEAATLRLDGDGRLFLRRHQGVEAEHAYAWHDRGFGGDCVLALQRHVLAHFQDGAPLENDGRAYLRNLEIEEAIYRSAASGRWQALPQIEPASTM